ncbi:MAG TPA: Na+/H+ antiporter NhaC family protein [Gemmatimonadales bacterium]|nr:Na+/H+ antiporter NhaC family protein [Gemmatimonadales bacterium]
MPRLRLPHPLVLLLAGVLFAAALTHVVPAGRYDRREDPATGRTVVVAGTYRAVEPAPVGPFAAFVAVPRGIVAAAEVVVLILLVGGAWTVVDKAGTLARLVGGLSRRFADRRPVVIALITAAFAAGGALENMQEEIIPLIPVLLVLARSLGFDLVTVAAMSVGAAMVGSAFSPLNPFQAGIALKLAELPLLSRSGLRTGMLLVAMALWIWWTLRHAARHGSTPVSRSKPEEEEFGGRDGIIVLLVLAPFIVYVIGVLRWGWGFNELSAVFLIAGIAVGLAGRLGLGGTIEAYLTGMRSVVGAAVLVGVARAISLVLEDGQVIDTILQAFVTPLSTAPPALAAVLMVPVQALIHIPVASVSGQAALTMPVMVPLSDLLGFSRDAAVLAYQTGAGLTELWTPTNGALMAILLAAGVPYGKWIRFVAPIVAILTLLGIVGLLLALSR